MSARTGCSEKACRKERAREQCPETARCRDRAPIAGSGAGKEKRECGASGRVHGAILSAPRPPGREHCFRHVPRLIRRRRYSAVGKPLFFRGLKKDESAGETKGCEANPGLAAIPGAAFGSPEWPDAGIVSGTFRSRGLHGGRRERGPESPAGLQGGRREGESSQIESESVVFRQFFRLFEWCDFCKRLNLQETEKIYLVI